MRPLDAEALHRAREHAKAIGAKHDSDPLRFFADHVLHEVCWAFYAGAEWQAERK